MDTKDISPAVIGRLPKYFRYLGDLKVSGCERISSQELSDLMKVTASQIRQDFNHFGGFGQQGYGYNVNYLYTEIGKILGINEKHKLIVVGAGHIGQAMANYTNFETRGFVIEGIFDVHPDVIGSCVRNLTIMDFKEAPDFIRRHNIDIAVITVPKTAAVEVAETLVHSGIKAIMNFAHVDLRLSEDVIVENVHLSDALLKLSYRLKNS